MKSNSSWLPGIDGLRAFSVALVLGGHLTYASSEIHFANHGVAIFFVISGFLITHLLLEEEIRCGRISLNLFYARRALRLLPPVLFFLTAVALTDTQVHLGIPFSEYLSSLLFFKNLAGGVSPVLGHFWSLSIEEQFYLIWPCLLILLPTFKGRFATTLGLFLLAPVWRHSNILLFGADKINWVRTDLRYDGLLAGCLLALSLRSVRGKALLNSRLPEHPLAPIACVILFLATLFRAPGYIQVFHLSAQNVAIGGLLFLAISGKNRGLSALLDNAVAREIGKISYALYLWQQLFCFDVHAPWSQWHWTIRLALTFAAATVSWVAIEKPLLAVRKRLATKAQTPPELTSRNAA